MPFGGRFLTRVLDFWIGFLEMLGARGMRWEWRKRAWRTALEARLASWENVERGVRTTTRMCRSCRMLVEGGAGTCPGCGASMRGVPRGGVSRALGLLVPGLPSLSLVIVTANVVMSIVALMLGGVEPAAGLMTILSPRWQTTYALGSKLGLAILHGQPWRLVTANYLHGGLLHLLLNSYALATLGPLVENAFGARRLFVIYTASGIAGFACSTLVHPEGQSVGASAAIFGLLGFAFVYGRYRSGAGGRAISDQLMRWLLYGLFMFFIPGIDNAAHIGGLIPGAILALVFDPGPPRTRARGFALNAAFAAALLITVGSFAAMAMAYGDNLRATEAVSRRVIPSGVATEPTLAMARGVVPRDGIEPPTQGFSVPRSTD